VRRFIEVKQPVIQENWFVKLNLGVGTAGGFSGKKEKPYFSFTNYITPGSNFSLDTKTGTSICV
jgi:hypothetical protein